MDFGEVLTRTWQITWRYKGLWVLGLLAGCGTGGGGGGGGGSPPSPGAGPQSYGQIEQVMGQIPVWVWVLVAVSALILVLVFFVLGVIGTGGLIAGFRHADEGQDTSLGQAFRLGTKYFWRLLGFRLLLLLLGIVAAALIFVAAIGSLGICLVPILCIGLPAAFLLGADGADLARRRPGDWIDPGAADLAADDAALLRPRKRRAAEHHRRDIGERPVLPRLLPDPAACQRGAADVHQWRLDAHLPAADRQSRRGSCPGGVRQTAAGITIAGRRLPQPVGGAPSLGGGGAFVAGIGQYLTPPWPAGLSRFAYSTHFGG
jgi:hypothetical protein